MRSSGEPSSSLSTMNNSAPLVQLSDRLCSSRWYQPEGNDPAQRYAAMALVASALSPKGFEKVQEIMEGDEVLRRPTRSRRSSGPSRRQRKSCKSRRQWATSRRPAATAPPWAAVRCSAKISTTFRFSESPPKRSVDVAVRRTPSRTEHHHRRRTRHPHAHSHRRSTCLYTIDGKTVGRSARRATRASLYSSTRRQQRKQAILSYQLADLVLGPGQDGKTISSRRPEGF